MADIFDEIAQKLTPNFPFDEHHTPTGLAAGMRDAFAQRTCQHCRHWNDKDKRVYPSCELGVSFKRSLIAVADAESFGCSLFQPAPETP